MNNIRVRYISTWIWFGWMLGSMTPLAVAEASNETGWFNVTAYGAQSNDDENDDAAIQAAIDAASDAGGGTVYIPRGIYLISQPLEIHVSHVTITGDGPATVLRNNGSTDAIIRSLSSQRSPATSLEHVKVEKLTLDGVDQSVAGIMATGWTRASAIRDLEIVNCLNGIDMTASWSFTIENNNINRCANAGLLLGVGELPSKEARKHVNVWLVNALTLVGNTARNSEYGIYWSGGNGWFMAGNTFELNVHNAVLRNTESGTIVGNYFEASKGGEALLVLGATPSGGIAKNLFIAGNMFYHDGGQVDGIRADGLISSQVMANRFAVSGKPFAQPAGRSARVFENEIFTQPHARRRTPRSSTDSGIKGQIAWDDRFMYICVGPDRWKRVEMTEW